MKPSSSKMIIVILLFCIVAATSFLLYLEYLQFLQKNSCLDQEQITASLKVKQINGKTMIGLNTDTDSLQFGVVSSGVAAKRSIVVRHSEPAEVRVTMDGQLHSWTSISPASFSLSSNQSVEVFFEAKVPLYTVDGTYTGTATFCFKNR